MFDSKEEKGEKGMLRFENAALQICPFICGSKNDVHQ